LSDFVVNNNYLNHKPACRQAGDHEVQHKVSQRIYSIDSPFDTPS